MLGFFCPGSDGAGGVHRRHLPQLSWAQQRRRPMRLKIGANPLSHTESSRARGAMPAGDSHFELILGDCVVQENWTSAGTTGYSGKSYNIYNTALQRWRTTLGGQRRRQHFFLWRVEGRNHGLLDG